jgi:cell division septation protein DedD
MRDLDQLQEQDRDAHGRRTGLLLMGALLCAGLVSVAVVQLRNAAAPVQVNELDTLERLDRALRTSVGATRTRLPQATGAAAQADKPVDPTQLTFQRALTEDEDRPEVVAALAEAAREEEALAKTNGAPQPSAAETALSPTDSAANGGKRGALAFGPESDLDDFKASGRSAMPAGLSASLGSRKLAKSAGRDRLVAAAIPQGSNQQRARVGSDGEYTLQVISFELASSAETFANSLRDRGHEAFVATGEVEGRGRSYRVRIGPFKTKGQADAYRRDFEAREHMNTILVRRQDTQPARD